MAAWMAISVSSLAGNGCEQQFSYAKAAFQFRRFFLQPPALSTSCRCPSFIFASSPAVTVIGYD